MMMIMVYYVEIQNEIRVYNNFSNAVNNNRNNRCNVRDDVVVPFVVDGGGGRDVFSFYVSLTCFDISLLCFDDLLQRWLLWLMM